jgi:hypothetical protein
MRAPAGQGSRGQRRSRRRNTGDLVESCRISSKPASATKPETSLDEIRRVYPSIPRRFHGKMCIVGLQCGLARLRLGAVGDPNAVKRERVATPAGPKTQGCPHCGPPLPLATEAGPAPRVSAMATPPATGRPETARPLHQRHGNARGTPQQRQSSAVQMDQCTRAAGGTDHGAVIVRQGSRSAPRVHWSIWTSWTAP